MITCHTPDTLRAFTQRVADAFNKGEIRHPVHLSGGNETDLLDLFQTIRPEDWICSNWRSHYHCLLKGVPEDELFQAILGGRSIALCFPSHNIVSSAIVGGCAPIALGLAWALKRRQSAAKVYCFIGDMAEMAGITRECRRYGRGWNLPVRYIVEDNGTSVCTPTQEAWGRENMTRAKSWTIAGPILYKYSHPWPHAGAGRRVEF